jgi:hypothetical protein
MHAITEPLALLWHRRQRPTGATLLRCVGRWDYNDPHASAYRLAMQDSKKVPPADIMCGLGQSRACDTLNVQGFMRDQTVVAHQLARDLVVKVTPLIGDVQMLFGKILYRLFAPVALLLFARDGALGASQRRLGLAVVAWRSNRAPIRCHQEDLEAKVNASSRQRGRHDLSVRQFTGEDDMPAIGFTFEGDGLDCAFNEPMQFDLDVADVLKVDHRAIQLATVAVSREFQSIKAPLSFETGIARCLTSLDSAEERLKGTIQPTQSRLATGEIGSSQVGIGGAFVLQARRLLSIRDRLLPLLPGSLALGKCSVVEATVCLQHLSQRLFLLGSGIQSVLEGFAHARTAPSG